MIIIGLLPRSELKVFPIRPKCEALRLRNKTDVFSFDPLLIRRRSLDIFRICFEPTRRIGNAGFVHTKYLVVDTLEPRTLYSVYHEPEKNLGNCVRSGSNLGVCQSPVIPEADARTVSGEKPRVPSCEAKEEDHDLF